MAQPFNARSEGLEAGDYRLTFSLDASCGNESRNTDFTRTQILLPVETETETEGTTVMAEEGSDTGRAVVDILPGYYLK